MAEAEPISHGPPSRDTTSLPPWQRHVRQLGLFFAGASFMAASVAISRRAVVRRQVAALPRFYSHNRYAMPLDSADRSLLAAQALGLATLNVMSFGILLVGGISWGFDLCSAEELQVRSRAAIRRQGRVDPEGEKALEKMMGELMDRLGMDKPETPQRDHDEPNNDE